MQEENHMEMTPSDIPEIELSRAESPRYEFRAECLLKLGDGKSINGEATNISRNGLFLQMENLIPGCGPNQRGQLEIIATLQDKRFRVCAPCRIVHVRGSGIGIQFESMDKEAINDLDRLVSTLSKYNAYYSKGKNRLLKTKYNIVAFFYDILDYPWERQYRFWRPKLLNDVRNRVLEMGVGTGRNLKYYHPTVQLTGIDISEQMLFRAERRSKTAACSIGLYKEDATVMALIPSSHYDWLISFFLCCVMPDRLQPFAIEQVGRVLKPGGRFRLLEMVYSKDPKLRKRQDFFAPFVERVYGARFDRNTLGYLDKSENLKVTNTYFIKEDTYLVIEGIRIL
ncbi:MAG: methyltransferase domain-containing protein [bacterium]